MGVLHLPFNEQSRLPQSDDCALECILTADKRCADHSKYKFADKPESVISRMPDSNPYASPATDSAPQTDAKLYSPGHVAWASFLGAPIAGCVLLALNYRRFGNTAAANLTLAAGFIGMFLLLVIAFLLPDNFPNSTSTLAAAYTFGMYQCAKSLQGKAYARHLADGRTKASAWAATGIGILCLICICIVLFAVALAAPDEWFGEEL